MFKKLFVSLLIFTKMYGIFSTANIDEMKSELKKRSVSNDIKSMNFKRVDANKDRLSYGLLTLTQLK